LDNVPPATRLEGDRLLATSTDPWSIGDIGILDNNQLANGPGIRLIPGPC